MEKVIYLTVFGMTDYLARNVLNRNSLLSRLLSGCITDHFLPDLNLKGPFINHLNSLNISENTILAI
jgi:hypothetical protein